MNEPDYGDYRGRDEFDFDRQGCGDYGGRDNASDYGGYSAGLGNSPRLDSYNDSADDFGLSRGMGGLDIDRGFDGGYGASPRSAAFDNFDGPNYPETSNYGDSFGHSAQNFDRPHSPAYGGGAFGNEYGNDPSANFHTSNYDNPGYSEFGNHPKSYEDHPFDGNLQHLDDFGAYGGGPSSSMARDLPPMGDYGRQTRFADDTHNPDMNDYLSRQFDRSDPYNSGAMTRGNFQDDNFGIGQSSFGSDYGQGGYGNDQLSDHGYQDHHNADFGLGSSLGARGFNDYNDHDQNYGGTGENYLDRSSRYDHADFGGLHDENKSLHDEAVYDDLLMFQNQLLSNDGLDEGDREQRFNERLRFEELDERERASRWNSMPDQTRWSLGLNQGVYGSRFGGENFFERQINEGMRDGHLATAYPMTSPIANRYSSYFSPSFSNQMQSTSYMDPDYLRASDLAAYSNALKVDQSVAESEKLRRWQERMEWEALDESRRADRYRAMAEEQRDRLGLGHHGFYGQQYGFQYSEFFNPAKLAPLSMPLTSTLRGLYQPYIGHRFDPSVFQRPDWEARAAYYDLQRFENELRRARLDEKQRMRLWRERLAWQEMSEARRRVQWLRMSEKQRRMLGLGRSRFFGSRYASAGLGYGSRGRYVSPKYAREGMRYALPAGLQRRYRGFEKRKPTGFIVTRNPTFLTSADPAANRMREQMASQQHELLRLQARKAQLQNVQMAANRARGDESRRLLAKLDKERSLAAGHCLSFPIFPSKLRKTVTSATTWRAPVR